MAPIEQSTQPALTIPLTHTLPTGWSWSRLDEVCLGVFDCPHSTPKLTQSGPFVVRTQDIVSGVFRAEGCAHVSEATYHERIARATPSAGDLLYSREGTYFGIAAEVPPDAKICLGQRMVLIRPRKDVVVPRFLRYWLNSRLMASYIEGSRDGSVAERLNLPTIRSLPVLIPPQVDQAGIAKVLGVLDDKIVANRITARTAEHLALCLPMVERTPATVGSVAAIRRRLVSMDSLAGQVEHFSLPAFDDARLPVVEPADGIKSGKFLLDQPSVLVSKLNPHIPRVWMATPSGARTAVTSTEFIGLLPVGGYPVEVLWALCGSPKFNAQLREMVKGTTGSHQRVAPEDMLALGVPDPLSLSAAETSTIVGAVRLAAAMRRESSQLARLRDTLLPSLLSGEARVRDAKELAEGAL